MAKSRIVQGDRVAYSAAFLRSIGAGRDMADGRGRVTEVAKLGQTFLARIEWENGADLPQRVNVSNLAKVGSAAFGDCHTPTNNIG